MSKILNNFIHKSLTTIILSSLGIMIPMLASATVTVNDLINKSFTSHCAFPNRGDLDDLGNILQYNLCGNASLNKEDIAQCSRVALTQYAVCRYTSVLDNPTTSISSSSDYTDKTTDNTIAMNYSSDDPTTTDNTDNKTTKNKVFNWF